MRTHIAVVTGAGMAALGLLLAIAAFAGFSLGLPAVEPSTALSASWFMIAVVLVFVGTFVALAARGLEIADEETASLRGTRPVRQLHASR